MITISKLLLWQFPYRPVEPGLRLQAFLRSTFCHSITAHIVIIHITSCQQSCLGSTHDTCVMNVYILMQVSWTDTRSVSDARHPILHEKPYCQMAASGYLPDGDLSPVGNNPGQLRSMTKGELFPAINLSPKTATTVGEPSSAVTTLLLATPGDLFTYYQEVITTRSLTYCFACTGV